jgi:rod shape determining protein RodA
MNLQKWRHFDPWLMTIAVVLTIIGIAFINSATLGVESLSELVPRQTIYGILGIAVALIAAGFDYRNLMVVHWWIYGVVLALLFVIFLTGQLGDAGARRWLLEGAVQPSELVKVLLILTLSQYLALRHRQISKLSTVLLSLAYMAVPVLLLFLQPDLGMSVELMVIWFVMVWLAGLRWRHLGLFAITGLAAIPAVWPFMEVYQKLRIVAFIDPSLVPDQEYNMRQALISIGSGGLFGKGYASGSQSQLHFLRVRHTDFIFSVIAEEVGLIGAMVVLILIALLVFRILRVARRIKDPAGIFLCYGVATLIFFQTMVSIGMNLQLLPVTGLTLPFISYGGSSLVTLLLSIGLVESVLMHNQDREHTYE